MEKSEKTIETISLKINEVGIISHWKKEIVLEDLRKSLIFGFRAVLKFSRGTKQQSMS